MLVRPYCILICFNLACTAESTGAKRKKQNVSPKHSKVDNRLNLLDAPVDASQKYFDPRYIHRQNSQNHTVNRLRSETDAEPVELDPRNTKTTQNNNQSALSTKQEFTILKNSGSDMIRSKDDQIGARLLTIIEVGDSSEVRQPRAIDSDRFAIFDNDKYRFKEKPTLQNHKNLTITESRQPFTPPVRRTTDRRGLSVSRLDSLNSDGTTYRHSFVGPRNRVEENHLETKLRSDPTVDSQPPQSELQVQAITNLVLPAPCFEHVIDSKHPLSGSQDLGTSKRSDTKICSDHNINPVHSQFEPSDHSVAACARSASRSYRLVDPKQTQNQLSYHSQFPSSKTQVNAPSTDPSGPEISKERVILPPQSQLDQRTLLCGHSIPQPSAAGGISNHSQTIVPINTSKIDPPRQLNQHEPALRDQIPSPKSEDPVKTTCSTLTNSEMDAVSENVSSDEIWKYRVLRVITCGLCPRKMEDSPCTSFSYEINTATHEDNISSEPTVYQNIFKSAKLQFHQETPHSEPQNHGTENSTQGDSIHPKIHQNDSHYHIPSFGNRNSDSAANDLDNGLDRFTGLSIGGNTAQGDVMPPESVQQNTSRPISSFESQNSDSAANDLDNYFDRFTRLNISENVHMEDTRQGERRIIKNNVRRTRNELIKNETGHCETSCDDALKCQDMSYRGPKMDFSIDLPPPNNLKTPKCQPNTEQSETFSELTEQCDSCSSQKRYPSVDDPLDEYLPSSDENMDSIELARFSINETCVDCGIHPDLCEHAADFKPVLTNQRPSIKATKPQCRGETVQISQGFHTGGICNAPIGSRFEPKLFDKVSEGGQLDSLAADELTFSDEIHLHDIYATNSANAHNVGEIISQKASETSNSNYEAKKLRRNYTPGPKDILNTPSSLDYSPDESEYSVSPKHTIRCGKISKRFSTPRPRDMVDTASSSDYSSEEADYTVQPDSALCGGKISKRLSTPKPRMMVDTASSSDYSTDEPDCTVKPNSTACGGKISKRLSTPKPRMMVDTATSSDYSSDEAECRVQREEPLNSGDSQCVYEISSNNSNDFTAQVLLTAEGLAFRPIEPAQKTSDRVQIVRPDPIGMKSSIVFGREVRNETIYNPCNADKNQKLLSDEISAFKIPRGKHIPIDPENASESAPVCLERSMSVGVLLHSEDNMSGSHNLSRPTDQNTVGTTGYLVAQKRTRSNRYLPKNGTHLDDTRNITCDPRNDQLELKNNRYPIQGNTSQENGRYGDTTAEKGVRFRSTSIKVTCV